MIATRRFTWDDSNQIPYVAQSIMKFFDHYGVERMGVENLRGLSRNRMSAFSNTKALNKTLRNMYYAKLLVQLKSLAFRYGIEVVIVSPKDTSKNTGQWSERYFGHERHIISAFLIARRALGLSIVRSPRVVRQITNGVWCSESASLADKRQPKFSKVCFQSTS